MSTHKECYGAKIKKKNLKTFFFTKPVACMILINVYSLQLLVEIETGIDDGLRIKVEIDPEITEMAQMIAEITDRYTTRAQLGSVSY